MSEGLSQFQVDISMCLFQYIQQNIRSDCSNIDKILEPPEGQDEGVWKYEHLRFVNNFLRFILLTLKLYISTSAKNNFSDNNDEILIEQYTTMRQ